MASIEHIKELIKDMSIDDKIKEVKDARFAIQMKDHWTNDDSRYDTELGALYQELLNEKKIRTEVIDEVKNEVHAPYNDMPFCEKTKCIADKVDCGCEDCLYSAIDEMLVKKAGVKNG